MITNFAMRAEFPGQQPKTKIWFRIPEVNGSGPGEGINYTTRV